MEACEERVEGREVMFKITVEGLLDDGTPVSQVGLVFDYDGDFDTLVSKLKRLIEKLVGKEGSR